jgi:hypothetical protein
MRRRLIAAAALALLGAAHPARAEDALRRSMGSAGPCLVDEVVKRAAAGRTPDEAVDDAIATCERKVVAWLRESYRRAGRAKEFPDTPERLRLLMLGFRDGFGPEMKEMLRAKGLIGKTRPVNGI